MKAYYMSHNFYRISDITARRLASPLPGNNNEIIVTLPNKIRAWLSTTPHLGRDVWSLYPVAGVIGKKNEDGSFSIDKTPFETDILSSEDDESLFT